MAAKFPVTSENGNEYRVEVYEDRFGRYEVSVYLPKKLFGLFNYWSRVHGGGWDGGIYNMEKWEYDIVKCAKHAVKKYENNIASRERHRKRASESFVEFNKWDGKIN